MVGCLRKVQGWDHRKIVDEYMHYAGRKARPLDEAFIQAYNPRQGIRRTAKRLNVASWVAVPDEMTVHTSEDRPHTVS